MKPELLGAFAEADTGLFGVLVPNPGCFAHGFVDTTVAASSRSGRVKRHPQARIEELNNRCPVGHCT